MCTYRPSTDYWNNAQAPSQKACWKIAISGTTSKLSPVKNKVKPINRPLTQGPVPDSELVACPGAWWEDIIYSLSCVREGDVNNALARLLMANKRISERITTTDAMALAAGKSRTSCKLTKSSKEGNLTERMAMLPSDKNVPRQIPLRNCEWMTRQCCQ